MVAIIRVELGATRQPIDARHESEAAADIEADSLTLAQQPRFHVAGGWEKSLT